MYFEKKRKGFPTRHLLFSLVLLTTVFIGAGIGCDECGDFKLHDSAEVTFLRENPEEGWADFRVDYYSTCADGTIEYEGNDLPLFIVNDDCHIDAQYAYTAHYDKYWCMLLCWPCWYGWPCEAFASYSHNIYNVRVTWGGKFELEAVWRDKILYSHTFIWDGPSGISIPTFPSTEILSWKDEKVNENAVFDLDEVMKFRVAAEWEPSSYPNYYIELIIKAEHSPDSLILALPLTDFSDPVAT